MYNQEQLINILKEIQGERSLNKFAADINVDSGYLSRIYNYKRTNPPTPEILKKIANNSKDIANYYELMYICGYITNENIVELENFLYKYNNLKKLESNINLLLDNINLKNDEKEIAINYAKDSLYQLKNNKYKTFDEISQTVLKKIQNIKNIDKDKVYGYYLLKVANELKTIDCNLNNNSGDEKKLKINLSNLSDEDIEDVQKYIDFIKIKKQKKNEE